MLCSKKTYTYEKEDNIDFFSVYSNALIFEILMG